MARITDRTMHRTARVRRVLKRVGGGRPRLSVFRSSQHIYAQVIDDTAGTTLVSASSREKDLRGSLKTGANVAAAKEVGKLRGGAREGQGRQEGGVRPRRLFVPRARQGARGSRPRGRTRVLIGKVGDNGTRPATSEW